MSIRSYGRNLSFQLLARDRLNDDGSLSETTYDPPLENGEANDNPIQRKRRTKAKKKKKQASERLPDLGDRFHSSANNMCDEVCGDSSLSTSRSVVMESVCESTVMERETESLRVSCISFVELRQRNANVIAAEGPGEDDSSSRREGSLIKGQRYPEVNGSISKFETMDSLDWKKVMAEHSNLLGDISTMEKSPLKYFMGEMYRGNSLRSTISVGNEQKRQRIIVARQFKRPNAAELSDFACFIALSCGVTCLQRTDISLIYHMIRGQGTIKLYVVYNVLEIFDKLCQSLGEDVLQVLFNSAEGLGNCSAHNLKFQLGRFIFDAVIAIVSFTFHSFILLAQAVTLSTCIISNNNALLALLVSNNFAEIKSNVFKRVGKDTLHYLVYYDIIERFHIAAFVLFVLAQNILEAEGSWFQGFLTNASLVYICEILVDAIKHSFLAKFNDINPDAYSEFLEDLCKQTLDEKPEERQKNLTFIPLAPACVVIRVLTPIYATLLPCGPFLWRLLWILIWSGLTYIILAVSKIMVGISLRLLATWYLNLRQARKQHVD